MPQIKRMKDEKEVEWKRAKNRKKP